MNETTRNFRRFLAAGMACLSMIALISGCSLLSPSNRLEGRVELLPGQDTPFDRVRVSIFRFDSGTEAKLVAVDEKGRFAVLLDSDGEYAVEALVQDSVNFSTSAVRVLVRDGRIMDRKPLLLAFVLTEID